jgi:hypothetical protein
MSLRSLRIRTRLWVAFGVAIALQAVTLVMALSFMNASSDGLNDIVHDRQVKINLITQVKYNVALVHQNLRNALLADDAGQRAAAVAEMERLRAANADLL